jgi:regulatory protein
MDESSTKSLRRDIRLGAMNLLARREHSRRELKEKLSKRFEDIALINQELSKLETDGLLSDHRFTQAFINARANKLYGPERIRQELNRAGIQEDLIEQYLQSADIDWQACLKRLEKKKFGGLQAADFAEKVKRQRFFQYRGFDNDMIRNMKHYAEEP